MTALDKRFRKLATKMIGKYGATITIKSVIAGEYNPSTGSSNNISVDTITKAVIEDFKPTEFVEGMILAGDKKFSIAADGITKPKPGDKMTIASLPEIWVVVGVKEIWSGEESCLFECQGRA